MGFQAGMRTAFSIHHLGVFLISFATKIFVLAIGLCLDFGTSSVLAALKLVLYRLGFEECQKNPDDAWFHPTPTPRNRHPPNSSESFLR